MLRVGLVMQCFHVSIAACALTVGTGTALGQDLSTKPIRVVTGSAGGSSDFVARQLAQALAVSPGWQVIVDNRPAVQQTEIVSKAAPDGHTVVLAGGPLWVLPLLRPTPYDPIKDFAPISLLEVSVFAPAKTPVATIRKINQHVVRFLHTPEAKETFFRNGSETVGSSPEELAAAIKKEMQRLGKVIKENNIRAE